jgi:low temperature requirement protein LtrA
VSDATLGRRFKRWFWRPPRPHGETIADRTVSVLELFYDLVYVAVISQAAHHLSEHVTARSVAEFAVVFGLIWTAWVNGSLYLELHGREDGRTRTIVFVEMGVLVLLAVFTPDAAGAGGRGFALVYAAFLAISTWLWNSVRRQDRRDHPEFLAVTGRYVVTMGAAAAVMFASAFLASGTRLVVWTVVVVAWIVGIVLVGRSAVGFNLGVPPTESLVERFGLFTIIVLGEFVFGVVDGLSLPDRDLLTITTGMIALVIGFGFWWIYFDLVGRRLPRSGGTIWTWMLSHLPIQLSIVAAGAAIVSLIEHAHDPVTPSATALLLGGSTAIGLVALILTERSLEDAIRLEAVYRPLGVVLATGAAIALLAGWLAPAPWVLAALMVAILSALWFFVVARMIRAGVWGEAIRSEASAEDAGAVPGAA